MFKSIVITHRHLITEDNCTEPLRQYDVFCDIDVNKSLWQNIANYRECFTYTDDDGLINTIVDTAYVDMWDVSEAVSGAGMILNAIKVASISAQRAAYGGYNRAVKLSNNSTGELIVPSGTKVKRTKKSDGATLKHVAYSVRGATAFNIRCKRAAELNAVYGALYSVPVHAIDEAFINHMLQSLSSDCAEMVDVAVNALYGKSLSVINTCYDVMHDAYIAVNQYIAGERRDSKDLSIEYIRDGGGDLIKLNDAMNAIVYGGDNWMPSSGAGMDERTAKRLNQTLGRAMVNLTKVQQQIVYLLSCGYSERQIAERIKRKPNTVREHIVRIRDKVNVVIQGTEFRTLVNDAVVRADKAKLSAPRKRTDAGKARDKATQAERARRYRERKRAEREKAKTE